MQILRKSFKNYSKQYTTRTNSYLLGNINSLGHKQLFCTLKNVYFKSRDAHIKQIQESLEYDVIIIGGGCNGVGSFLDSSTRGFKTLLLQKDDFGSGTSSKSTKLFHGGVRYLQQAFQLSLAPIGDRIQKFTLVKQAIIERGQALINTCYLSKKIPFIIPCTNIIQKLYYYAGSMFYYLLFKYNCPPNTPKFSPPKIINKIQLNTIFPYISQKYNSGVIYQDGCFNDSRVLLTTLQTVANLKQARKISINNNLLTQAKQGNYINKAQVKQFIKQKNKIVGVKFVDKISNKQFIVKGKYVINCTGAWADKLRTLDNSQINGRILSVGGVHLTYDDTVASSQYGLCMPSKDGRVTLVVPWLKKIIIGTTQQVFNQPTNNPTATDAERQFIRDALQQTMSKLPKQQIRKCEVSQWCGLRPLVMDNNKQKDTKSISRDFIIEKSQSGLYSVMGGKWTIFRLMGQKIIDKIVQQQKSLNKLYPKSKTLNLRIIGSQNPSEQITKHGIIGQHLYNNYGFYAKQILKGDLTVLHDCITISQIQWILNNQMITQLEDIIFRRTRIGFLYKKDIVIKLITEIGKINGRIKNLSAKQTENLIKQTQKQYQIYNFGIN